MKTKPSFLLLLLVCIAALAAGCESSGQRAGSVDLQFPPAPMTPLNAPDNNASGISK
jgi:hypothetical protein